MSKAILNFDVSKIILILLFFILIRQSTTSGSTQTVGKSLMPEKRLIVSSASEKLSKEDCSTMKGMDDFSCFLNRIVEHELTSSCTSNDTLCNGEESLNAMLREQNEQKQQEKPTKKMKIKYDYKSQKGLLYYSFNANGTLVSLKHQSHKPFIVKNEENRNQTSTINALNEQIAEYESNVHLLESLLSTIKKQLKVLTKNKKLLKKMDHKMAKVEKKTPNATTPSKKGEKEANSKQESSQKSAITL